MLKKKIENADVFFLIMILGNLFVHLSRIRMGMVEMDESFYLTIPYRLVQGDALLVDEWHLTQLQAVLLFPILKIYLCITKSTEGIYLAFRYIWLACSVTTAIISYVLLRKKDKYISAVSCVMISLFTYGGLRALSYNTMGVMTAWLLVSLMVTDTKYFKTKYFFAGIVLALIVLCNPYMIMLYIGYVCTCLVKREKGGSFGLKALGFVTFGGMIIAILLLYLIFSRATVFEVLTNLKYIFDDPAHQQKTFITFFKPIIDFIIWFKLYFILFAAGAMTALFNRKLRKLSFVGLIALSCIMWILLIVFKTEGVGRFAIYLPLMMLGILSFILTKKRDGALLWKGWIIGIIYAVCMNLASNQGIYVIFNAFIISSGISLFMIKDYLKEEVIWPGQRIWLGILAGMQIFTQVWVNWNYVFWADDISELKYEIESGPMKGVYVSSQEKEDYEIDCNNVQELGELGGEYVMFFNYFPAGYFLVPEARCGAFSAWLPDFETPDNTKLIHYYELHPDRVPDVVYFDTNATCQWSQEDWESWREKHGF